MSRPRVSKGRVPASARLRIALGSKPKILPASTVVMPSLIGLLFTGELFVVLLVGLLQCFVYSLLARVIPFGGAGYLAMMAILVLVASALRPNFPYTPVGMEAQNLILAYPKNSPIVEITILLGVIVVLFAIDQAQKFRKVKV